MNRYHTKKLILSALFTALCCVATMLIRVPSPTGGYLNAGDAAVLLGAFLLGPFYGAAAAGLGSALADILSGFPIYAPGTLVIKALMALTAGLIVRKKGAKPASVTAAAGLGELIMIAGYFAYTAVPLGFGTGAVAEVPGNIVQAVFGAAVSIALFLSLSRVSYVRSMFGND